MISKRTRIGVGVGLAGSALVVLVGLAVADARSDLESRKRDYDNLKRELGEATSDLAEYLEDSRDIRSLDLAQLEQLIIAICGSDIERSNDDAAELAKDMTSKAKDQVEDEWEDLSKEFGEIVGELEDILDDAKSLRDSVKSIPEDDDVKSDRQALLDDVIRLIDAADRAMAQVQEDYKAAANVKNGVMLGANNPRIRAAMEHGKDKHTEMQRDCHASEVVLSSGRPDCVMFDQDDCKVVEFKPSSVGESAARDQASRYISDVQTYFKDDERAVKNCKKDSSGVLQFTAVGKTYPACTAR